MKIYKFRNFTKKEEICYFNQIVLQKTMWCAKPDSLNDKTEFKFELDYRESNETIHLLADINTKYKMRYPPYSSARLAINNQFLRKRTEYVIRNLIANLKNDLGIASFTRTNQEDHLWNKYGGKGNGACIEIEIPDDAVNQKYCTVSYVQKKKFHVDEFLKADLDKNSGDEFMKKILTTKDERWRHEKEIRFIKDGQQINEPMVNAQINEVIFGARVPKQTLMQVEAAIADHCNKNNIRIKKL